MSARKLAVVRALKNISGDRRTRNTDIDHATVLDAMEDKFGPDVVTWANLLLKARWASTTLAEVRCGMLSKDTLDNEEATAIKAIARGLGLDLFENYVVPVSETLETLEGKVYVETKGNERKIKLIGDV